MEFKQSLAQRIIIAFALMSALVAGAFAFGIVATVHLVEERLISPLTKHDRWAALASLNADAVVDRGVVAGDAWVVALEPGDVLYVPARWWHEVVNHTPSVLLSGFFGTRTTVYAQWVWRQAVQGAHLAGLWRRGHCTCHPARV